MSSRDRLSRLTADLLPPATVPALVSVPDNVSSTPKRGRRKADAKAFARFSVSSVEFSRFVTLTFRSKRACAYS